MTLYCGDFPANATVRIPFHTFDSVGASVTITGFAAADIEVYKNGGATARASDNGYTATTNFSSITGCHMIVIDTSDNSDAGFYAVGNEYQVAVSAITVDSQTVSFWAGTFSIARTGGAIALLGAGVTVATNNDKTGYRLSSTGVDDILDDAIEGTRTFRQILRGFSSALLSKISGGGTATETFRDIDDSKNRITATVDVDGNRTAITLDLT